MYCLIDLAEFISSVRWCIVGAPERPPPPVVGKVTHHNIELYWEEALETACENNMSGDERVRVAVQEEDKQGEWGNVYMYVARWNISELNLNLSLN